MNNHKDCYLYIADCNTLDELRDSFSYWSNNNKDCVIISHCITLIGMQYMLSISYYYLED